MLFEVCRGGILRGLVVDRAVCAGTGAAKCLGPDLDGRLLCPSDRALMSEVPFPEDMVEEREIETVAHGDDGRIDRRGPGEREP